MISTPGSILTIGLGGSPALMVTLGYGVGAAVASGHSGVTRLWLIDYYTTALQKQKEKEAIEAELKKLPEVVLRGPRKKQIEAIRREKLVIEKVNRLADKAQSEIEAVSRRIRDVQAAQAFTQQLMQTAIQSPVLDFEPLIQLVRKQQEEDDEDLLLFAMVL